ncbi:MAG: hypothetical protein KKD56_06055, partial [Acidobacteria bacterium]|nr:hypothetical protein [Acidobacteriota bacterium]
MTDEKKTLSPEMKEILRAEYNQDWRKDMRKAIPVKERMKIKRQKMPERLRRAVGTGSGDDRNPLSHRIDRNL